MARRILWKITGRRHWLFIIAINLNLAIRSLLGKHPLPFYPISSLLHSLHFYGWQLNHPVRKNTDICVEGFRSSANTFFVYASCQCNDNVEVGHHQHVVAQIKRAKQYGIPIVILIRRPLDVVTSYLSRSPNCSATILLRSYIDFYDSVLDCTAGDIVAVRFETILRDFNLIVDAVNEKFGTSFNGFNSKEDFVRLENEFFVNAPGTTKPSREREELKDQLKEEVRKNPWLSKANAVYEKFLSVNVSV